MLWPAGGTVAVIIKFTFRFRSTIVLRCERSWKTVWNCFYVSVSCTVFTGFERSKIFDRLYQMQPASNGILPGLCFKPWISLPAGLCSVSRTFTEREI